METRLVATTTHGRYLVAPGSDRLLVIGFHGYGENAERHLADLQRIEGIGEWTIASVQALHPFYNSKTQEIIASWMTSLDREIAIADNIAYVRRVREAFPRAEKVVFEGFSQGAAMAYRSAAASFATGVITLGGDVPPDVIASGVRLPPVLIARGERDEWYSEAKFKKDLKYLESTTQVEPCVFDGGHEWTDDFRDAAARVLRMIAGT
jgi:predicted esterase